MPKKWIKKNPQGLEGTILAYVKELNLQGLHDLIFSSANMQAFIRIYLAIKGVEEDYHLRLLIDFFDKNIIQEQEVISVRTAVEDIDSIASKYDCDIIEISLPKPKTKGMSLQKKFQIRAQYEDDCMTELSSALNDYYTEYWKKQQTAKPNAIERKDCTKEEWKYIFSELHESLVKPSANENYTTLEKDIRKLCEGISMPDKLIPEMILTAKQKKEHWKEKLGLYKALIFALEAEAYERAGKIKKVFQRYS